MRDLTRMRTYPPAIDTLQRVKPGDLITADTINQLIAHIQQLEARIAVLESAPAKPC